MRSHAALVVLGGEDHDIRCWNLNHAEPELTMEIRRGHNARIASLRFSDDGKWVFSGANDGVVRRWSLPFERIGAKVRLRHRSIANDEVGQNTRWNNVESVAASADGRRMATGAANGWVRLWVRQGEDWNLQHENRAHNPSSVRVAFSQNGDWLVSGGSNGSVLLWDASKPEKRWTLLDKEPARRVTSVAINGKGTRIVASAVNHAGGSRIIVWERTTAGVDQTIDLNLPQADVHVVSLSADGRWLTSGGHDRKLRLHDLETGQTPRVSLLHHPSVVLSVRISRDGRWVVTGSGDPDQDDDHTVRVWKRDGLDLKLAHELRGHRSWIRGVAISDNGRWLVSGSEDTTVRLWDLQADDPQTSSVELRGHSDKVYAVDISSDGRRLACASHDDTAVVWNLDVATLIDRANKQAGRELTKQERSRFLIRSRRETRLFR